MELEFTRRSFLGGITALFASGTAKTYAAAVGAGRPNLSFGVVSDIHITPKAHIAALCERTGRPVPKAGKRFVELDIFEKSLRYFDEQGCDAVMVSGDIADDGFTGQLQAAADCWYGVFPGGRSKRDGRPVEKLFIGGNHDLEGVYFPGARVIFPNVNELPEDEWLSKHMAEHWERIFHEKYAPIYMKEVKGYKFIGAHWHDWDGIPGVVDFMKKHGDEVRGAKPFFFFEHQQPANTCFGTWAFNPDPYSTEALKSFPNAVAFSGHSHKSLLLPYNFWQGSFTSIGAATLCTLCGEYGRENGSVKFQNERIAMKRIQSGYHDHAHGMFVRVYDSFMEISRRDFATDEDLGETIVIPLPATEKSPFFYANQKAAGRAPGPFPDGAKVSATWRKGNDGERVYVKFPVARNIAGVPAAADYEIEAVHREADVERTLFTRYVYSPRCYSDPLKDSGEVEAVFLGSLFPSSGRTQFKVRAREAFGHFNEPILSDEMNM